MVKIKSAIGIGVASMLAMNAYGQKDVKDNPRWLLYSGPLHLKPGSYNIRVKAVRYGYKESEELKGVFEIK